MRSTLKYVQDKLSSRWGFFLLTLVLFWIKTVVAYETKFTLGSTGSMQQFLLYLNPIPTALLLFGIAIYFRGKKSYWILLIVDFIQTTWLFANMVYYREFSDFLSLGIIKNSGSVANNLDKGIAGILRPTDFFVYLDVILLILLLIFKLVKIDYNPIKKRYAFIVTIASILLTAGNLGLAGKDRPQLLTRTFDNNYIVKYLGLNFYAGYNVYQTQKESATRKNATSKDMDEVLSYLNKNRAGSNIQYYGKAKGKNVFVLHLESFQQFMIDYKWDGQEVTPTINKYYHDQNTLSFDNFFHQVGQGKTSDAEMMLESSLYGLPSGSAMTTYGTQNTFQSAPAILDQKGYSTAAFHGDVGSFWNRNNTYKSFGYQYFFSEPYYDVKTNYKVGYGMKDKIFLKQSTKYIEQLPQPFYAKLITLTNHYPYDLDSANVSIKKTTTDDSTVDGYVQTSKYLDQSFEEFVSYLKKSGLYKDSMIVMYGDHYGISNNHKKAIAQLLGKKEVTSYDLTMFQKVPFMIHMDGLKGGINHTYGGEIDVLPTLLDLLGVKNTDTVQFGNDLLSKNRNQTVAFRNGDFVSPNFTKVGNTTYDTKTGKEIKTLTAEQQKTYDKELKHVTTSLSLSDSVITGDLLRFYTPSNFTKVNKSDYNYKKSKALETLKKAQKKEKTSLIEQHGGVSTEDLFKTDAPELK
ncbi:LTA synthase family protein [Dellaglioa algida]|uniref:Phosphatidylglycerol--membrane-oligosaccharide glycerophosphotransferase n=1 Tax=Dellaglioa algida DSM 15638 TaxID=1423719 RepID=A0A0R1HIH5_9LACO|nr:LTA synthase family protein [Dellaglioa algida]KRK46096.1 phosphatidylglycerol--membrane-oligosaccharide glycerophosphotransferase [Dellaglioa algida DSM 15638]MDK1725941.1 LTA synthase family protein [Dellaglioa algida]MDK1732105.1 LTA synthase family protein [Dellaglioa algida]MDK1733631.1 LTA synthase family protein [Dellaglioa algida]